MYRLAGALCIVAGHEHRPDEWPCESHIAVARRELAIASTDTGGLPTSAGAVDGVTGATPSVPPGSAPVAPTSSERRYRVTGSEAGCYFVVANDFNEWIVVGIPVGDGDGWVQGRHDDRDVAVAEAERWTQLAAAVSSS